MTCHCFRRHVRVSLRSINLYKELTNELYGEAVGGGGGGGGGEGVRGGK